MKKEKEIPQKDIGTLEKEIADQMNLGVESSDAYLNLKTGEIYRIQDFALSAHRGTSDDDFRAEDCVMLPTIPSQETYLWMCEFTATVQDAGLRRRLEEALDQIAAQWLFRNILYHNPEIQNRWAHFKGEKLLAHAKDWITYLRKKGVKARGGFF